MVRLHVAMKWLRLYLDYDEIFFNRRDGCSLTNDMAAHPCDERSLEHHTVAVLCCLNTAALALNGDH